MPNEVFLRTRAGLSTMVSSRAAGRILEGALKGSGHNPDDVDQSQMRSALLGPVLEELENVLPRDGLKRNLEQLARSLRESGVEREVAKALLTGSIPANVVTSAIEAGPPEGEYRASASVATSGAPADTDRSAEASDTGSDTRRMSEAESGVSDHDPDDQEPALRMAPEGPFEAYQTPPSPARRPGPVANGPGTRLTPRLWRRLAENELDETVKRFALIENVRLVAAVRADGSVPVFRGEGLDLELLSRLSRLSFSLLAKGGDLRSLHLGHSLGQLFLFPIGPDLLIVYGGSDLNLGSVTTAFTALALEEEL